MIFDQETLKIHITATIVGVITGVFWWGMCAAVFSFEVQDLWMSVMGCVLAANLGLLSAID